MNFDFTYNDASGQIQKVGHYSRCEEHEATREEVFLWQRVQELEQVIERQRPASVRVILDHIFTAIEKDRTVFKINPVDFAMLRQHAQDKVKMVTNTSMVRDHILGEIPIMDDGSPYGVWLIVDRNIPQIPQTPSTSSVGEHEDHPR